MRELNSQEGRDGAVLIGPGAVGITQFVRDLLTLAKFRVVALLVFTAAVGEILAPGFSRSWVQDGAGLIGIGLAGGAGAVFNQLVEPTLDQHMKRTRRRPLADGRIKYWMVVLYAGVLLLSAVTILAVGTNLLTLALTLAGTVGYGIVYTLHLKPATPWNIVWGGIAGALPPLIGWTAVTGHIALMPFALVALIFVWTPAHFWPLALSCREDYAKACIPMLPVTHGVERTRTEIVKYALATFLVSLVPAVISGNWIYGIVAVASGGWYVLLTWRLKRMPVGPAMDRYGRTVFGASISYLFILFAALVLGHLVLG
ncbi:MAG TPA: heme o synthase [Acidiferrobacter sp.]|nr:heme o synthase [Acidiferrobacter sp.]